MACGRKFKSRIGDFGVTIASTDSLAMSKQYRVSLSTSRLELTQVLAHLQEDALEEPDRQLLMRLVQQ
jgi:hypothetical protein